MRRLLSLALVLFILVSLAACTSQKSENTSDESPGMQNPPSDSVIILPEPDAPPAAVPDDPQPEDPEPAPQPLEYEVYEGEVPHIFLHCLIADPSVKDKAGNMFYDADCINVTEFCRLLDELYANGYSLVDLYSLYTRDEQGNLHFLNRVEVPKGRKPVVISVDDVVYDERKRGKGMVDFLALDRDNNLVSGTYREDGTVEYTYDQEIFPILEQFIAQHPDFSAHNARMTLCMTGFTGVFGYRTDADYEGNRTAELQKANAVAARLKELGYSFACHSYGHGQIPQKSLDSLKEDVTKFQEEVVPIIGETPAFIYPYGLPLDTADERYQYLVSEGFELFCSVSHFFFSRNYDDGQSLYMTRIAIDGYSLRFYKTALSPVVDVTKILDTENRLPIEP